MSKPKERKFVGVFKKDKYGEDLGLELKIQYSDEDRLAKISPERVIDEIIEELQNLKVAGKFTTVTSQVDNLREED